MICHMRLGQMKSLRAHPSKTQLEWIILSCKGELQNAKMCFRHFKKKIVALLDGINQEKYLEKQSCLKSIVHPSAPFFLNPPEFSIVKYSVDLQFGAAWMWDKVARILLQNTEVPSIAKRFWAGVPPPVEVGDVVKVLEAGSTIVKRGEYTVVGVQGDECTVEKEGEKLNFPRDRLLLTIRKKYRYIADKVLTNEIGNLNEEDPNLVADMEEVFELAGVREAFQQTLQAGDPRYLQTAMKNSETFHYAMRQLPGIKASPIQKPGKGGPKPDPAEMSSMYTSESAVKDVWERMRNDWSQLVVRLSTFSAADTLPYLDLLGSQAWRLARIFSSTVTTRDVGEEVEELSCVADFLTKDGVDPVQGNHRMAGFRLPHLQLLALAVATDLRHHASIVGANLQSSKKMRKLAKKSRDFSAFFKLLSCHATDDTEALCKVFGPFASLAIRIALFLRVEVEEHANKGWTEVVGVFSGRVSERKLYDKAVQQVAANARKFIEKFMGGFGYEATGKVERVKKRIRNIFRRPRGKAPQNSGHHKVGHDFAKLILIMWTNGSQHLTPSKVEDAFRRAREYQTLAILNHGQGVALLRIALKNVKAPTADVTGRLFSFLAKILAIRKEGTKGLYKFYLQWVKDGETSQQINEWNDSIEVFECSWHSSQEEQNHMLAEAGKVNEHDYAAEGSPAPELESCSGNLQTLPNPVSLNPV
ncbi:hypothetical protein, conserved [Eimeria praecox]|uniref:Uncharacterized protein n=1 Tax=Eimeria praecox TaxID=51316 RepID=U6GNQ9_9EIME|nr:hypothetical protein, conserved [Eimeria praecox]